MNKNNWQWNEFQQIGTDYSTLEEVAAYDQRMASFRNVDEENRHLLDMLHLPKGASLLEIGCGTGRFSLAAARDGHKVTAIDISREMLEYVKSKALKENLTSITTRNCGFLSMDFPEAQFDAVVSGIALHHLPDAWKFVALRKIAYALKPEGQFILCDVVFSLKDGESPEDYFLKFIESFNEQVCPGALEHIKEEFSTYDWIMEGLLKRSGFRILSSKSYPGSFTVYHCRRGGE